MDSPVAIFKSKKMPAIVSDSSRFDILRKSVVSSAFTNGEIVVGAWRVRGEGYGFFDVFAQTGTEIGL